MPRRNEPSNIPFPVDDQQGFRHFGDGLAGRVVAARVQGYSPADLGYVDLQVDASGVLQTSGGGSGGGGGAVTAADGALVGVGSLGDVAWVSGNGSLIAVSKAQQAKLEQIRALLAGTLATAATVSNFPATQAVSLATNTPDVTDRAARLLGHVTVDSAPTTAITAAALPLPTGAATETTLAAANTNLGTDGAAPPAITGTGVRGWLRGIYEKLAGTLAVTQSGTWTVQPGNTANTTAWKVDGSGVTQPVSGSLTANQGTANATPWNENLAQVGGVAVAATAKGTQGSNFIPVQEAKDSGRVNVAWTAEVAGAATTEGLLTVTESRDGAATTTFTTKAVTSGKRLRITGIALGIETLGSGTAPQRVYLRMRFNTAGAVTAASPIQGTWLVVNNAAIVKSGAVAFYELSDGYEFAGDGTKQIGFTIQFPDWVATTGTVQAKVTVNAFEY